MMMFAILFGLSMDYEVLLLSRIEEEYDRTGINNEAVPDGLSATARVITAAATIMICVFGSFAFWGELIIKEFGLGLAVAIRIDATVVRMILVPATIGRLGDANWRLDDLDQVDSGQTDQQLARARSVQHSRGTSNSTTSDIAKFAGPLLRVRDPHTPVIREAPDHHPTR